MDPFYDPSELRFLGELIRAEIEFIVIGGAAVQFYGHDRPREDLDVWWKPTANNALQLRAIAAQFATVLPDIEAAKMSTARVEFRLQGPYNFIHLLNEISGVDFDTAAKSCNLAQTPA